MIFLLNFFKFYDHDVLRLATLGARQGRQSEMELGEYTHFVRAVKCAMTVNLEMLKFAPKTMSTRQTLRTTMSMRAKRAKIYHFDA